MPAGVKIRALNPDKEGELPFVCATWKTSFWESSPFASRIKWQVFLRGHGPIIERLVANSKVLVAVNPDEDSELVGYIVYEPDALHYCYVKSSYRGAGVGTALFQATGLPHDLDGIAITHGTRAWFSSPSMIDRHTGVVLRQGKLKIEEKFPLAVHDPYRGLLEKR